MKSVALTAIIVVSAWGQAHDPQVLRIAALGGNEQVKALRSALIGPITHAELYDTVFYCEERLRGSLRRLVSDRKAGIQAAYLLSLIADPEDLRAIIRRPPRPKLVTDRWAYRVACSLLDASNEEDWNFLRDCLMGKYADDLWASIGAIQTLKLIGSERSVVVLQDAQRAKLKRGERWHEEIASAISFTDVQRPALRGSNLEELTGPLAQTLGAKNAEAPRLNQAGNKALVNVRVIAGRDLSIYTASFSRAEDYWRLRGLQEVAQVYFGPDPNHK